MSEKPTLRVVLICVALMLCGDFAQSNAQRRRHNKKKVSPAPVEEVTEDPAAAGPLQIRLKLKDGTRVTVDDAWENEQGFWYRKNGITSIVTRDRATGIERSSAPGVKPEPQIAKVTQVNSAETSAADGPAWIHLVGGARVEADTVAESASGVWYRRGSLSIFIERSRIDHIERESEKIADSASNTKKDRGWSTGSAKLDNLIRQNGSRHGVDPYLVFLVMEQESHFNPRVVSPKGARGLMQLMPGTGARFGVRRPFDPAQNISGGTRYLRQLLDRFNGRVDLVLASYNAGEGAVIKFGHRVPPYRETRNYVKKISYRYKRSKPPVSSAAGAKPAASGGN
jgi:Transglycosylase SLT domain